MPTPTNQNEVIFIEPHDLEEGEQFLHLSTNKGYYQWGIERPHLDDAGQLILGAERRTEHFRRYYDVTMEQRYDALMGADGTKTLPVSCGVLYHALQNRIPVLSIHRDEFIF